MLRVRVDGEIAEAIGTIVGDGPIVDFEGELPDGRPITASVNCASGP